MTRNNIVEQTGVEHELLKAIMYTLRNAIGWKIEGGDFSRKLSTIRYMTQCLQRHLDRLLALEEFDGYMDVVVGICPRLSSQVFALRQEHDQFRKAIPEAVHGLEQVPSTDEPSFTEVCGELLAVLQKLDEHTTRETTLLHEAFEQEIGGEG